MFGIVREGLVIRKETDHPNSYSIAYNMWRPNTLPANSSICYETTFTLQTVLTVMLLWLNWKHLRVLMTSCKYLILNFLFLWFLFLCLGYWIPMSLTYYVCLLNCVEINELLFALGRLISTQSPSRSHRVTHVYCHLFVSFELSICFRFIENMPEIEVAQNLCNLYL